MTRILIIEDNSKTANYLFTALQENYYVADIASEKNITVTCNGEALLYADPILFKRVISNLLSNALRYTVAGRNVHIQIVEKAESVAISIQDAGIGIAEEHLFKLFDRFYRVDAARSSDTGGLGLGLAITKSIMDLHQGHITIQSKVNAGTEVCLEFPTLPLK